MAEQFEEFRRTAANAKLRDKIFLRWFMYSLLSPVALLPVAAFVLLLWRPELAGQLQEGLAAGPWAALAARRSLGTDFVDAAHVYWLTLYLLLPVSPLWMHWWARRQGFYPAARAVMRGNLDSGRWNMQSWTVRGGWLRLGAGLVMGAALAALQMAYQGEPSSCRGCETGSRIGFLLVNWIGLHSILLFTYLMGVYLFFWRFVRQQLARPA